MVRLIWNFFFHWKTILLWKSSMISFLKFFFSTFFSKFTTFCVNSDQILQKKFNKKKKKKNSTKFKKKKEVQISIFLNTGNHYSFDWFTQNFRCYKRFLFENFKTLNYFCLNFFWFPSVGTTLCLYGLKNFSRCYV